MPTLPSGFQITLSAHDQELVVVEVGGGLRSYAAGGRRVLDGYPAEEMCSSGRGQILAPWPNRLDGGWFDWEGQRYQTPLSQVAEGNAIHGLVRWSAWAVQSATPDRVVLSHRLHPQSGWPWRLDFVVDYRLSAEGLGVHTSVTNDSYHAAPFGLGWHPYLDAFGGLVDDTTLSLPAAVTYLADERSIPTGSKDVAGSDLDFRGGRSIGSAELDTCFTDLARDGDGRAWVRLEGPASGAGEVPPVTELWVDRAYTHLMVFSGDTVAPGRRRRGLAVEPMTCAPNALRSGDGLITIGAGQTFEAGWGIRAS